MVSRRHAVVRPLDGGLEIDDLGSTNGTWVNGERIEGATRLAAGDVIGVGSVLAVVEWDEAPTATRDASVVREATVVSGALPEWQTFAGKGVTIHAPRGSYPAGRAAAELRDAEKAIAALEALLSPPQDRLGEPVEVYLTDAVVEEGSPVTRASAEEGLLRVVQPENPGPPVVYDLARLLVGRWFGPEAAKASLFVDGIAGIAGSRLGSAPSIEEADEAVRAELAGEAEVSVFSPDPGLVVPISFVGFLLKTHGPEPLRRFLETYDPERRDQAAAAVYQRPLGSLEELWLASLRELTGFRATFRALLGHLGSAHAAVQVALDRDLRLHGARGRPDDRHPARLQVPVRHDHPGRQHQQARGLRRGPVRDLRRERASDHAALVRDRGRKPARALRPPGADVRAAPAPLAQLLRPREGRRPDGAALAGPEHGAGGDDGGAVRRAAARPHRARGRGHRDRAEPASWARSSSSSSRSSA